MPTQKAPEARRGAALLLSLLVLLVLVAIMSQLNIATVTDARVSRNDLSLTAMDLAIESSLLEVTETLLADAEAAGEEEGAGTGGEGNPFGGAMGDAMGQGGGEGGGEGGSVDSRQDDWASPIRTEINGIRVRVLIQDEDSKLNALTMLSEDEVEAEKAFERVVRILDWCREGTKADIDGADARQMAEQMLEHLRNRTNSFLPRPVLLTDNEEEEDLGLPLSLREFVCLEAFTEDHFRDFRDEDDIIVHSIGSFLTCFTAVTTRDELATDSGSSSPGAGGDAAAEPEGSSGPAIPGGQSGNPGGGGGGGGGGAGEGGPDISGQASDALGSGSGSGGAPAGDGKAGVAVNINTTPSVVLKALMDDRDVDMRFWDAVIEWRNEEDEDATDEEEDEPPLDEFGEPIVIPKIFESLGDLDEFDDYRDLDALLKGELDNLLTVESHVFSIFITARKPTGVGAGMEFAGSKEEIEEEERDGQALSRTVRCVVWRRETDDGWELVPLERWEVLDYMPFEVEDFPEEDR